MELRDNYVHIRAKAVHSDEVVVATAHVRAQGQAHSRRHIQPFIGGDQCIFGSAEVPITAKLFAVLVDQILPWPFGEAGVPQQNLLAGFSTGNSV
jgi:hypothetical protein